MYRFSPRKKESEPCVSLCSLGVLHQKDEPPEYLALKAMGLIYGGARGLQETETPFLKGTGRISYTSSPSAETVN